MRLCSYYSQPNAEPLVLESVMRPPTLKLV